MRFDEIAALIENANDNVTGAAVTFCVANCVADGSRPVVPQLAKWQRVGDQVNSSPILSRSDFVSDWRIH
jgi:hypothetical protein